MPQPIAKCVAHSIITDQAVLRMCMLRDQFCKWLLKQKIMSPG